MGTPSYAEFADGYGLTAEKMRFYWDCYAPNPADRLSPFAASLPISLVNVNFLNYRT